MIVEKPVKDTPPNTTFDIDLQSQRRQAVVLAEPVYDPKNKRLRA